MTTMMTIGDPDWTVAETAKTFDAETPEAAAVAADTMHAWLVKHTPLWQDGWTYTDGTFILPASDWSNLVDNARELIAAARCYAIDSMDETRETADRL